MSNFWTDNPDLMMRRANALRHFVAKLEDERAEGPWDEGRFLAGPLLLALATEIALKAWQRRERGAKPDHGHDLLKLFRALSADTRERISARMVYPVMPYTVGVAVGIEAALAQNRSLFVDWRYGYEHTGVVAETGHLRMALDAIVEEYRVVETFPGFIGE